MTSLPLTRPLALICDLDQTLVDTRAIKALRSSRSWNQAYAGIPRCSLVPGAGDLLTASRPIPVAVVTNSPAAYARRVLARFGLHCDELIAFHDVRHRKPHPEPFLLALSRLGLTGSNVWSVGDQADDIVASRAAGIVSVIGILSACDDRDALLAARPSALLEDWKPISVALLSS